MSFDDFYKRFVAFGLALALGLFAAGFLYRISFSGIFKREAEPAPKIVSRTNNDALNGGGISGGAAHAPCYGKKERCFSEKTSAAPPSKVAGLKIVSKPHARYTSEARANNVQGKVVLRVIFKADGKIGAISVITGLSDGLNETAIEAAKGIKFEPATRDGAPYSVTKPVEYTFTIY